jgi:hypothetical protein
MPQANPRAIRLINALQAEDNEAEQNAAFADLMREKVAVALDARKVALTPEMFGEGSVVDPNGKVVKSVPKGLLPQLGQHGVTTGKSYKMKKFSAMHNRDEEVYAKVIKQSRNGPGGPVIIHYTVGNSTRELEMPATRFISKIIK